MKILLDTNSYVAFCKAEHWATEPIRTAERLFLPIIALGELRAGLAAGKKSSANEKRLAEFLNSPRVEVLPLEESTTQSYAALYVYLKRSGRPVPTNDLWIAALAYQHSMLLLTHDAHFKHLPQIAVIGS